jgi:hypothetical protein
MKAKKRKRIMPKLIHKPVLMELAKSGGEKPRFVSNHRLTEALHYYMKETHVCYDAKFTEKIKKLVPEWFDKGAKHVGRKKEILEKAEECIELQEFQENHIYSAKSRVLNTSQCYWCTNYTNKKSDLYDAEFTEELASLQYRWVSSSMRGKYTMRRLSEFVLESGVFPSGKKNKSKTESYHLYYWWRDRKTGKTKIDKETMRELKKSFLPNNIFELDMNFFSVYGRKLFDLRSFYQLNGRIPQEESEDENEREIYLWLDSRKRVTKRHLWNPMFISILKHHKLWRKDLKHFFIEDENE